MDATGMTDFTKAADGDATARHNALILAIATGLAGANAAVVFATAALVGRSLSSDLTMATIPASTFVFGIMISTFPVAYASKLYGRRLVFMAGNLVGALAGVLAALSVYVSSFALFCVATAFAGAYQAVVQSYRYAAADTATPGFRPKAISWVLTGGVAAAFIGPQLVIHTKELMLPYLFLATFLGQALVAVAAMAVTGRFIDQNVEEVQGGAMRPMRQILAQPRLIVAILCGTVAQALMNFVMTAAPLAMAMCGHSVVDSTLGIQWHIIAMFAPSFFTGSLIARYGKERMVAFGLLILALCGGVGLTGIEVMHFWAALILLGVGWNFAFIGATAMVTDCHTPAERARVQGLNDFVIFSFTTFGSFLAGVLLAKVGWAVINMALIPMGLVFAVLALSVRKRPATA
jgi:MFS family permease